MGVQLTAPEIVFVGGTMTNDTEPVYHPLLPLGEPGFNEIVGVPGPVVSRLTEKATLLLSPALSVAVQVVLYLPCVPKVRVCVPRLPMSDPKLHVTVARPEMESLDDIVPDALIPLNQPLCPLGVNKSEIVGGVESYLKS